jgi:hypothetical protein
MLMKANPERSIFDDFDVLFADEAHVKVEVKVYPVEQLVQFVDDEQIEHPAEQAVQFGVYVRYPV